VEPARTIDDALARFELLRPREGDAKVAFHGVYERQTIAVKEEIQGGGFRDPDWLERWDVVFADLYLDALELWNRGQAPSGPWQVAFEAASGPRIPPLIHVLIGMNAHVNFDLPQALLAVITDEELADADLVRRRQRDFAHVDDILVEHVKQEDLALRELEQPGDRRIVDRMLTPLNRAASKRFLKEARAKVWRNAVELSAARWRGAEAYAARLAELEDLSRAKVDDLVRPGQVLLRLGVTGFGVTLPVNQSERHA
jgi:hypothetical protein